MRLIAFALLFATIAPTAHATTLQAGVAKQAPAKAPVMVYACSLSPVGRETPCIKGYPKWVVDHGGKIVGRHVYLQQLDEKNKGGLHSTKSAVIYKSGQ